MRWMAGLAALALSVPASAQVAEAQVTGGTVAGTAADGFTVFKGIPFAAPPTGPNRWRAPQPVKPWTGTLAAYRQGAACMQDTAFMKMIGDTTPISEDCLYLNVWTPARTPGEKLPVMVWVYGGGFAGGATSLYDGSNFAKEGVVFVSLAYRVGPFGFMGHKELTAEGKGSSGNYGLRDQIAGLKWVQENIAKFGGDSKNVTVFGESAGAVSVSMLTASPLAKGLFAKAISESGGNFGTAQAAGPQGIDANGGLTMRTTANNEAQGAATLKQLGVASIAAARALPADRIQAVAGPMGTFWPSFDGQVLPKDQFALYEQGQFNDTPILIGTNSNEGELFMPPQVPVAAYEAGVRAGYGAKAADVLAAYPARTDAEARMAQANIFQETAFAWQTWAWAKLHDAKSKNPAYVYYFDHRTPMMQNGAWHASEIRYVFNQLEPAGGMMPTPPPDDRDRAIARAFTTYWINFAKTGDPNGGGQPVWTAFDAATPRYMGIGDAPGMMAVPNLGKLQMWDDYYAWRRAGSP